MPVIPKLTTVLTKQAIQQRVEELGRQISNDYQGCSLVLIGILNGAFIFLADLVRNLSIPAQIDFVRTSSYGSSTTSSGSIRITKPVEINIQGKDVLIVEDIADTGLTLSYLINYIQGFEPKSIKICAFIDKRERREQTIRLDYIGYVVPKGFLVGYGLDYAQEYRGLPEIFEIIF